MGITATYTTQKMIAQLENFGLRHVSKKLFDLIEQAEREQLSHRQFLSQILEAEVSGRNEKRRRRNYAGAHFPDVVKPLEMFDPHELRSGITQSQIDQMRELDWIDHRTNLLFLGPPGTGKTMLSIGYGLLAVERGYTVCFERMVNLVKILDEAPENRLQSFRLKNIMKASLVTIITLLTLSIGSLLGGTAIVESIFMWDGVGKLAVDAINMRDYPIIQAYVMWMAIIYVVVNLITDLSYHFLDPRIRLGGIDR